MSIEENTRLVPKLRFPEFRDSGVWKQKSVENYFDVGSSKRVLQQDWTTHGVPFYRTRELVSLSKGEPFASEIFIAEKLFNEVAEKYGIPEEGDFLVSGVGTLGISYLVKSDDKFYFKDGNVLWFAKREHLSSKYFKYCFESDLIQNQITKQASVSTVGTYTIQNAKTTKFLIPSTEAEQQKIADCLSSLDELIAAQARKVDVLKTHKKGLMQQIFPREGETQPRLRFPEFQNAGEWKVEVLGQLMTIKGRIGYRGYTVEDIVEAGEGAISLSPSNISAAGTLIFEKATYISWAKFYESPEIILEKNFTVLVKTGSTYGKVAFIKDLPHECTVNPQIVVLKPTSINPYFLYLLISGEPIQSRIEATVVGGAIPTLSQENVSKFVVSVPSGAEQQRIADCLTSLDDLITANIQDLETLKTHKEGMMQQLFPRLDEGRK